MLQTGLTKKSHAIDYILTEILFKKPIRIVAITTPTTISMPTMASPLLPAMPETSGHATANGVDCRGQPNNPATLGVRYLR